MLPDKWAAINNPPTPNCACCRNGLASRFDIELPATLVFQHPTPAALAAFIAVELARCSASTASADPLTALAGNAAGVALSTNLLFSQCSEASLPQLVHSEDLQQELLALAPIPAPAQHSPADRALAVTAVAGVACRFPGSASGDGAGLASFWLQAASGRDVQSVVPLDKWDAGGMQRGQHA